PRIFNGCGADQGYRKRYVLKLFPSPSGSNHYLVEVFYRRAQLYYGRRLGEYHTFSLITDISHHHRNRQLLSGYKTELTIYIGVYTMGDGLQLNSDTRQSFLGFSINDGSRNRGIDDRLCFYLRIQIRAFQAQRKQ